MLSYRHAFHAGNHADVLKHLVLVHVLDYLAAKDKPLWYIDTHAGAGRYHLGTGIAAAHAEFHEGIARLWDATALPPALKRYREVVRTANGGGALRYYPGSPQIARLLLRPQDRLWLYELHPTDSVALERAFRDSPVPTRVQDSDGFAGLRGLLPPQPRRALAVIDPSYELAEDYGKAVAALRDALTRFPTGVYLLWYPQLARHEARSLPGRLEGLGATKWLHATLRVREATGPDAGLFGSGVFVLNPPYTLRAALADCADTLTALLAPGGAGSFTLEASKD